MPLEDSKVTCELILEIKLVEGSKVSWIWEGLWEMMPEQIYVELVRWIHSKNQAGEMCVQRPWCLRLRGHARSSPGPVAEAWAVLAEEADKEQKLRETSQHWKRSKESQKNREGSVAQIYNQQKERERIHESACGPGNSPPLIDS